METPLLICVRVLEMDVEPATGSVQMACTECGSAIWVAASSQDMLVAGGPYKIICMQCASELSKGMEIEPGRDASSSSAIERLQAEAESAFDRMYELHEECEIRRQFELATGLLTSAERLARDAGLPERAEEAERRRRHIRMVYYHQFVQPPKLLM